MSTVAVQGIGAQLNVGGNTSPVTYSKIAQLKTIKFGGFTVDFDEITNLDSGLYKEWMKTLVDAKELSADGVWKPSDSSQQGLITNINTSGQSALEYWQVLTPDGTSFLFQAYVSDYVPGIEYNKAITFSLKLKITGPVDIAWS